VERRRGIEELLNLVAFLAIRIWADLRVRLTHRVSVLELVAAGVALKGIGGQEKLRNEKAVAGG
jgi:hypothetical protein